MNALELSRFEFCPRLAQLSREWEPQRLPIRDALRVAFDEGIADIRAGLEMIAPTHFLSLAASRGFTYPSGSDPYTAANDAASWLEGALRVAAEQFNISAVYTTSASTWEQLLLGAEGNGTLMHFPIPALRDGRIRHPLTTAYLHPMTLHPRLSPHDGESFSARWKPIYRWEHPEFTWDDWRNGIDADHCMGKVYAEIHVPPADDRESILADAQAIRDAIPLPHPRLRANCSRCPFEPACHHDQWSDYIRIA